MYQFFVWLGWQDFRQRADRLLILSARIQKTGTNVPVLCMAGMAGFEPANDGTKNRCLTTWRHPIVLFELQFINKYYIFILLFLLNYYSR